MGHTGTKEMSATRSTLQHAGTTESMLLPAHVLIVDDEAIDREVLLRKLTSSGYLCEACADGASALRMIAREPYDVVLCDLTLADMKGATLLKEVLRIRSDAAFVLVTEGGDVDSAVAALKEGAYDYVVKPYSLEEVSVAVSRALERRRLIQENREYERTLEQKVVGRTQELRQAFELLQQTYRSTLMALSTALDTREPDFHGHSQRVMLYALELAGILGVEERELRALEQGALLHDIGKLGLPDSLLRKKSDLSEGEWVLMRRHPEIGFRILSGISFLQEAARLVLQHQERFDGTGYPAGLKGTEILPCARILAVADTLEAMTSNRPFQAGISFEEARIRIAGLAGNQLDPEVANAFFSMPVSIWVEIRQRVLKTEMEKARLNQ
jgi:putative two-component system response regulator